jgi:hypothetical protein
MGDITAKWSQVPDSEDFSPLAAGRYAAKITEVDDTRRSSRDDPIWSLKHEVTAGERAGRWLYDNLVFSEKGMKRAKLVLLRLGIPLVDDKPLKAASLVGAESVIDVIVEDYEARDGSMKKRNVIPYAGYHAAGAPTGAAATPAPAASKKTTPAAAADLWNTSPTADNDEPPF